MFRGQGDIRGRGRTEARRRALAAGCAALLVAAAAATALTLSPTAEATVPACSSSTAAVTSLHRPSSDPTTARPFYSAADGVDDSGYAGWELAGPDVTSDTWVNLSGFTGGSLGLASHQSAAIPARALSQNGNPIVYAYLTAPSASATAQTFTVEVWNGKPGQAGSTEVCTYSDGFSSVIKTISANANKITSVSISNSSPAIGGSFSITADGSTGTMGSGDATDRVSGNGTFSMAPAMADSWPADAFTLTGVTLALQGSTTHDVLRVYPTSASSSSYTATYDFTVRGSTSGATSVLPVQNIASGTQVKYTGSFPTTVSQISAPTITTTVTKTVQSFASSIVTYRVDVQNSSTGSTTLDSLEDTPTPTSGWTLVAGSARLGTSTIADPAVSTDHSQLFFEGPFTVPAASGGTPGELTITYELQLSAAVSNSVIATVGGQTLGASGGGTANQVTVDPAAPVITTGALASATVGTAYSQTLAATNGTTPYSWSISAGSLPAGLSLGSGGVISGTPTAAGTASFTVLVTDAAAKTASAVLSLDVASGAAADTTAPQSPALTIDGGAATTSSTSVTLGLSATDDVGVTAYRVAEGSSCSNASWVSVTSAASYSGSASFALNDGDGSKTICAQYEDAAGNVSSTATASITLDAPPTVTLSSSSSDPTRGAFDVTATFSKSVTGFASTDVAVGNGSVSGFAGSGTTYSFTVTPTADGSVTVDVAAGVAADTDGATNSSAATLARTYDGTRPTVTLSTTAASTVTGAFTVTATFSEAVTGFASTGVSAANGTVGTVAGSGSTYSFAVMPNAAGTASVHLPAGAASDAAGNQSAASNTLTRTYSVTSGSASSGATTTSATTTTTTVATPAPAPAAAPHGTPNIRIQMSASQQQVTAGETFTTTVTATNVGGATATDVALHIALPANAELVSGDAALVAGPRVNGMLRGAQPTAASWPCTAANATVTCPVGDMTPSARYVVNLNLRALRTGLLTVNADTTASNAPSRHAQVKVQATPAHVAIELNLQTSEPRGTVQLDEGYTVSAVLRNSGGTAAKRVSVSVSLPRSSSYVGADAPHGIRCRPAGRTVTCAVGAIGAHASRRVVVHLHADAPGKVRVAASGRSANQAHIGSRLHVLPAVRRKIGFSTVVFFASGSAQLSPLARFALDRAIVDIALGHLSRATLSCNTDDVGSLGYNLSLSRARCGSVAAYLTASARLRHVRYHRHAWAYLRPAASNATRAGKARNRRVEVRVD